MDRNTGWNMPSAQLYCTVVGYTAVGSAKGPPLAPEHDEATEATTRELGTPHTNRAGALQDVVTVMAGVRVAKSQLDTAWAWMVYVPARGYKAREVGKEVPEPTGFRKPEVLTMRTAPAPPTVHAELLWEQDTVLAGREFQVEALVGYTITVPA